MNRCHRNETLRHCSCSQQRTDRTEIAHLPKLISDQAPLDGSSSCLWLCFGRGTDTWSVCLEGTYTSLSHDCCRARLTRLSDCQNRGMDTTNTLSTNLYGILRCLGRPCSEWTWWGEEKSQMQKCDQFTPPCEIWCDVLVFWCKRGSTH